MNPSASGLQDHPVAPLARISVTPRARAGRCAGPGRGGPCPASPRIGGHPGSCIAAGPGGACRPAGRLVGCCCRACPAAYDGVCTSSVCEANGTGGRVSWDGSRGFVRGDRRQIQSAVLGGADSEEPLMLPLEAIELDAFRRRHEHDTFWCGLLLGGCGLQLTTKLYTECVTSPITPPGHHASASKGFVVLPAAGGANDRLVHERPPRCARRGDPAAKLVDQRHLGAGVHRPARPGRRWRCPPALTGRHHGVPGRRRRPSAASGSHAGTGRG